MQPPQPRQGTVLVLGAAVWPGGVASPALRRRVARGVEIWEKSHAAHLVISGGVGAHAPSEAEIGGALAREAGVPQGAVIEERSATSTLGNLVHSLARFDGRLPQPAYLVSDWYHLPRAYLAGRILGQTLRLRAVWPTRTGAAFLRQSSLFLRECVALTPTLVNALRHRSNSRPK